eukprot:1140301-Alexandrium_andersonii.AAC.1
MCIRDRGLLIPGWLQVRVLVEPAGHGREAPRGVAAARASHLAGPFACDRLSRGRFVLWEPLP